MLSHICSEIGNEALVTLLLRVICNISSALKKDEDLLDSRKSTQSVQMVAIL